MRIRKSSKINKELVEVIEKIREEHQENGENDNSPIIVTRQQLRETRRKNYEEKYGEPFPIEEIPENNKKTGNTIMLLVLLVSLTVFFTSFFISSDVLLGFGLSGMVLSPAFASTFRNSNDHFREERKVTWKFRAVFIVIGGLLLLGAIAQALGN